MKQCRMCGKNLEKSNFNKCSANPDGLQRWCKGCQKQAKSKWDKENQEHRFSYKLQYNSEHRIENVEYSRQYRKNHPGYVKKHNDERKLDPEKYKEIGKRSYEKTYPNRRHKIIKAVMEYRSKNKEKTRCWSNKCHAKRKSVLDNVLCDLTTDQWIGCLTFFDNKCVYCGEDKRITQDHVMPITKNGEHTKTNVVPACFRCNCSKNDSLLELWYPKQKFYSEDRLNKIISYISQR